MYLTASVLLMILGLAALVLPALRRRGAAAPRPSTVRLLIAAILLAAGAALFCLLLSGNLVLPLSEQKIFLLHA